MPCENCGSDHAHYVIDPFLADVHNETTYRWLCDHCYQTRVDDI